MKKTFLLSLLLLITFFASAQVKTENKETHFNKAVIFNETGTPTLTDSIAAITPTGQIVKANLTLSNLITDAPSDGNQYTRKDATWNLLKLNNEILANSSTGLLEGAVLTVGVSPGTFSVSAGKGLWVDSTTDFDNLEIETVTIAEDLDIVVTNILTHPVTYVCADKDGLILQSVTFPDASMRRSCIFLGVVVHSDNTTVSLVNNLPVISGNILAQVYDRWHAEGDFFNHEGNIFSPNGFNLLLDKTEGEVFKTSSNWENDREQPHTKIFSSSSGLTFRYRLNNSTEYSDVTSIDPNNYDLAGVLTAVPSNKYTIQRISIFPSGITRLQYGQNLYDSREDAEANLSTEPFIVEANLEANGLLRGFVILEEGTTDLSDPLKAFFVQAADSGDAMETNTSGAIFRTQLLNDASTGIRAGGLLTVNGGDTAKFDLAAGTGRVIDNTTDPTNPTLKEVRWEAFIANTLPNLATETGSYIAVDADDNLIIQTAPFTRQEYRELVVIGLVGHSDFTTVTNLVTLAIPFVDPLLTTLDLAAAIGTINTSGNTFFANGANMILDKTVGSQFRVGVNQHFDSKNPHNLVQGADVAVTFIPLYRDGSGGTTIGTPTTTLDPTLYDDGDGTLGTVASNKWTVQMVYYFASDVTVVAYGQTIYDSYDDAVAGATTDDFEIPETLVGSVLRSAIVMKQNATSLLSSDQKIITFGKFGGSGGGGAGGGGGGGSTLQAAYDASTPNPEILTNATNGALAVRRGSLLDTDNVLEIQNNASDATVEITGNGDIKANELLVTESVIMTEVTTPATIVQDGLGQIWVKNTSPTELWFTDSAGTANQLGSSAQVIYLLDVTISAGQMAGIFTSPVELIADPGVGYLIKLHAGDAIAYLEYGGVTYNFTGAPTIQYTDTAAEIIAVNQSAVNQTKDYAFNIDKTGASGQQLPVSSSVQLTAPANPISGNGTLRLVIPYSIIDLN